MPLYEYECEACGSRFERIQKFSDPPVDVCANCGERKVRKLVSSPAIQFKGSGFYINDYAKKGAGTDSGGSASKDSKDKDTKDSSAAKDTKSSPSDSSTTASSSGSTDTASATPSSKQS
jgi:putative FmdB family regulatory protein